MAGYVVFRISVQHGVAWIAKHNIVEHGIQYSRI